MLNLEYFIGTILIAYSGMFMAQNNWTYTIISSLAGNILLTWSYRKAQQTAVQAITKEGVDK